MLKSSVVSLPVTMSPVLSSDNGLQSSDEEADEVPHQTLLHKSI